MTKRMNDEETVQYMVMQSFEEDCIINAKEKIEYPPVAISLGEKLIKSFKRVLDMNNCDYSKFYHTFGLRTLNFKTRIQFIEYCLEHKVEDTGLLILDGIADLVSDVNNIEESNACIQKIMEWSQNYKCHIICVIHSNFGSDKPTGHLGSFLEKKTETQIQLEANTVNKEWVTVRCKRSRGYSFETFSFKVNEIGLPEIIGDLYDPLKN